MFTTKPYAIAPPNFEMFSWVPGAPGGPANATVVRTNSRMMRKICAKRAPNAMG